MNIMCNNYRDVNISKTRKNDLTAQRIETTNGCMINTKKHKLNTDTK